MVVAEHWKAQRFLQEPEKRKSEKERGRPNEIKKKTQVGKNVELLSHVRLGIIPLKGFSPDTKTLVAY